MQKKHYTVMVVNEPNEKKNNKRNKNFLKIDFENARFFKNKFMNCHVTKLRTLLTTVLKLFIKKFKLIY